MEETVQKIFVSGKGVLALDWSPNTIAKRFDEIGLTSTPELNRVYRQMVVTTSGIDNFVSGVILHEETINQKLDSGETFPDYLKNKGIVVGVRGDEGSQKFNDTDQDMSKGIENLDEKLAKYSSMGIKFSKWRAGVKINDLYPSKEFLEESINRLVQFAKISHKNNLVPFVEPDIEMDGNHTTTRCAEISHDVLKLLFEKLELEGVDLTKVILKTNMVLPGRGSGVIAIPLEVAGATLRVFRETVPAQIPGIVFLSGGMSFDDSVTFLDKIEDLSKDDPWKISFSFARALQEDALKFWKGEEENVAVAQKIIHERLEKTSKARNGEL